MRAATLSVRERDYVRAARASGARAGYVMLSHVLPNVATPIIVALTLTVGRVILFESVLSFLGFGIVPPTPSWGNMLNNAQELVTHGAGAGGLSGAADLLHRDRGELPGRRPAARVRSAVGTSSALARNPAARRAHKRSAMRHRRRPRRPRIWQTANLGTCALRIGA